MAEPIGSLRAVLEAETASWKRDLGKATAQLRASEKRMNFSLDKIRKGFNDLKTQILFLAGPLVIGALIKRQLDIGDQFAKMSVRTGVAIERLSAYGFGAKLSGVETDVLEKGLVKLGSTMRDSVVAPASSGARALQELGISITDSNGKLRATSDVIEDISRKFEQMADGNHKTALSSKIFGENLGGSLVPFLNNLQSTNEEARRTGNVISKEFALNAEQFNDSLTRMGSTTSRFVREEIVGAVLPGLNAWIERLNVLIGAQDQLSLSVLDRERAALAARMQSLLDAPNLVGVIGQTVEDIKKQIDELDDQIIAANKRLAKERSRNSLAGGGKLAPTIESTVVKKPQNPFAGADKDTSFEDFLADLRALEEALRTSLLTRQQIEQAAFGERLAQLLEARAFDQVTDEQFLLGKEEIERAHQARLTEIANSGIQGRAEFEAATSAMRVRSLIGFGAQELAAVANTDKRLFKVHKLFALADLAASAPQAIGAAIARGGGLPWGAAFGVLTAAKYIALAASARSATFGGSTSPASVGGGGATPTFQAPQFPTDAGFNAPAQPGVTVILQGDFIGTQEFFDDFVVGNLSEFFNRDGVLFSSQSRQGTELVPD